MGKSSLVRRFVDDRFEEEADPSIALSIHKGAVERDDITLEMMLWDPDRSDTSSQYNRSFISGASGLVFVVDVTRPDTLDALLRAHVEERGFVGSRPAVLVLNKDDLESERRLSEAQLSAAARVSWHMVRASAKTGANVEQAFSKLAELMLDARKATG